MDTPRKTHRRTQSSTSVMQFQPFTPSPLPIHDLPPKSVDSDIQQMFVSLQKQQLKEIKQQKVARRQQVERLQVDFTRPRCFHESMFHFGLRQDITRHQQLSNNTIYENSFDQSIDHREHKPIPKFFSSIRPKEDSRNSSQLLPPSRQKAFKNRNQVSITKWSIQDETELPKVEQGLKRVQVNHEALLAEHSALQKRVESLFSPAPDPAARLQQIHHQFDALIKKHLGKTSSSSEASTKDSVPRCDG